MDEYAIMVAGVPARVGLNTDGFFADVTFQHVFIDGSPLVVHLNPPVATISEVGAPALLGLIAALANGATFQGFPA